MSKLLHYLEPFHLELGGVINGLTIAFDTYGTLNADRSNCVWVCHALTANSDVADWWPHTVEKGKFLDPEENFIVCANILGSHYGTTGPLSENPVTGSPYYTDFPRLTIRDMARAHILLADTLGLTRIKALVGSSVGGFQALEWAVEEPWRFEKLVLIATDAKASAWTIALDETQRMAIKADPTYGRRSPTAGMNGMAAARAIGLLSYRGPEGYNATQTDPECLPADATRRATTYQQHQGDKLCQRYNAYSYVTILDAFDTHDVGRGRGGVAKALRRLQMPVMVVGISTDIVFTVPEMHRLCSMMPNGVYKEIDSRFGHDGFLVEHEQLNDIIKPFMQQ
ncbi:MAG: homoserine O-acetyltransferase [Muribaculaceae bacterium]|nr:homoserine O-acetyltransferase [Muribaculaceae bacterium]